MNLTGRFRGILDSLPITTPVTRYVVAYSGGVDSHVLLHLCHQAGVPVRAIHINHGLQREADQWGRHCADVCREMEIACANINVNARAEQGDSPENAARNARYAALYSTLEQDECMLTAHHRDDQSETLLLQLFRGAGPAGLAAMPVFKIQDGLMHARPMLAFSREDILEYASLNQLSWIEDPSNKDIEFDRNLVRNTILPVIKQRWPQVDASLYAASQQQQDALDIMNDLAEMDLATVTTPHSHVLSIESVSRLPRVRQFNVLRYWLSQYAKDRPTGNALQQIIDTVLTAADDTVPVVCWGLSEVRRYQNCLHLLDSLQHDESHSCSWNPRHTPVLEILDMKLSVGPATGQGLCMKFLDRDFRVAFRTGGESIRPAGRGHTHQLKKLMQEAGIPPWLRSRIPLLFLGNELVCVCGYWLAEGYVTKEGEEGWVPVCSVI